MTLKDRADMPIRKPHRSQAIVYGLLIFLVLAGFILVSPLGQPIISHLLSATLSSSTTTVTITPDSKDIAENFTVIAVTGTPDISSRQVKARVLSATSPPQSASADATGALAGNQKTVTQNDIESATDSLVAAIEPDAQNQLKDQERANEDVVPDTLNCSPNVSANHAVGDVAPSVTVTGTVICSEEVYDRAAALVLATNALKADVAKNPITGYALVDNDIVAGVTRATVIDSQQTVSLLVRAEGVWVYQFSDQSKQQLAGEIANKSMNDAQSYLLSTTGVSAVTISVSNGNTMPAAGDITIIIKAIPGMKIPAKYDILIQSS